LDDRVASGVSLEQSLRELLTATAQQRLQLQQRLAELRRQTPLAGRELVVAALIRKGRKQRSTLAVDGG
jgi:RNase P/RNase MRP subunit p30